MSRSTYFGPFADLLWFALTTVRSVAGGGELAQVPGMKSIADE